MVRRCQLLTATMAAATLTVATAAAAAERGGSPLSVGVLRNNCDRLSASAALRDTEAACAAHHLARAARFEKAAAAVARERSDERRAVLAAIRVRQFLLRLHEKRWGAGDLIQGNTLEGPGNARLRTRNLLRD